MKITRHEAEIKYRNWISMQNTSRYPEYENLNEFIESLKEDGWEIVDD